jgi:hypothetical protein
MQPFPFWNRNRQITLLYTGGGFVWFRTGLLTMPVAKTANRPPARPKLCRRDPLRSARSNRDNTIMPIAIFDSASIPRNRRPELEAAVVAAGNHLSKRFEGWIVATSDRREFAVRITSYPEVDIPMPFAWNVTTAEVTERVRAAMDD